MRKENYERIGNISQIMPFGEYRLVSGKMDGARAASISNGSGLEIIMLPDRCMDIFSVRINGRSVEYHSPAGITHPSYAQPWEDRWLSTFPGGFLSTCGLDNIGSPCELDNKKYPQHGGIGNSPAEQFSLSIDEDSEIPTLTASGTMRQAEMFGPKFLLTRKIQCSYGSPTFSVTDTIKNIGFHPEPFMQLYHFNFGYPLLSEKAELYLPSDRVAPRTKHAENHMNSWREILPPQDNFSEMCYYHYFDHNQMKEFAISNTDTKLKVGIKYESSSLDHFVQWKMFEKGTYVMGLEPANATIDGRADAKANGSLKVLDPGQKTINKFYITAESLA